MRYTRPRAGYLAWLDFRETGIGVGGEAAGAGTGASPSAGADDGSAVSPSAAILRDARVALNDGADFGLGGEGFVRLNLACAPATIAEAVRRIAAILPTNMAASADTAAATTATTATATTTTTTEGAHQ